MKDNNLVAFIGQIEKSIDERTIIKITVSNRNDKANKLIKIMIKLIEIKEGVKLSFVYRYATNDITKNYEIQAGIALIYELLTDFSNAILFTPNEDIELIINKKGFKIRHSQPKCQEIPSLKHDRQKIGLIELQNNIYLRELGVVTSDWQVKKDMHDKFKQINKYIEIFDSLLQEVNLPTEISVADMGSGKGYLTFAVYDYLTHKTNFTANVTGIEFRKDLVDSCNAIAQKSEFAKLNFLNGTIETSLIENIDILIALHACDTATDEAIYKGIVSNASLIICAPCCHKQIRKQFKVENEFSSFLKHGILEERQAELITDAIRALILEAYGYKTKVFEFISNEHTAKNIMIVGIKTNVVQNRVEILQKINSIKKFYGIQHHHLEKLLKFESDEIGS